MNERSENVALPTETITGSNDMAFPVFDQTQTPNGTTQVGLTKRELFAAMAMQGLCANSIPGNHHAFRNTAQEAVQYANELLMELAK